MVCGKERTVLILPLNSQLSLDYSGKWDSAPEQDDGGANLLSVLERPTFCVLVSALLLFLSLYANHGMQAYGPWRQPFNFGGQ